MQWRLTQVKKIMSYNHEYVTHEYKYFTHEYKTKYK